jgi:hypothetical protein
MLQAPAENQINYTNIIILPADVAQVSMLPASTCVRAGVIPNLMLLSNKQGSE